MAALLNNLASVMQQLQKPAPVPGKKKPVMPTPVTPITPLAKPRGTLLTGVDAPVSPRKTLLGS